MKSKRKKKRKGLGGLVWWGGVGGQWVEGLCPTGKGGGEKGENRRRGERKGRKVSPTCYVDTT